MKHAFQLAFILVTCSCVAPSSETEEFEGTEASEEAMVGQALYEPGNGKCPPNICGMNSGDLSDGGFFYDLNLDGLANDDGYSLTSVRKGSALYDLEVDDGRLTATLFFGMVGSPHTLSGTGLAGAELRLKKVSETGVVSYRSLFIDSVSRVTDYWARRTDGVATPKIETYKFRMQLDSGLGAYLCQNGATFVDPSSPVRAMPEHHALVFEGERIDVETLTLAPTTNSRWFNIGCAETALAKMHLNGHTKASKSVGFTSTIAERQTMLKMLTADYCGTGNSFTVSGQRLRWSDDRGTMTIAPSVTKVMEARWDEHGAVCLNTPRVDAHPTDASREEFEWGARLEIDHECTIPACGWTNVTPHLVSWNPTPFTP